MFCCLAVSPSYFYVQAGWKGKLKRRDCLRRYGVLVSIPPQHRQGWRNPPKISLLKFQSPRLDFLSSLQTLWICAIPGSVSLPSWFQLDPPWLYLCCHPPFLLTHSSYFWIPHLLLDNHAPGSLTTCVLLGPLTGYDEFGPEADRNLLFLCVCKYTFLLFLFLFFLFVLCLLLTHYLVFNLFLTEMAYDLVLSDSGLYSWMHWWLHSRI